MCKYSATPKVFLVILALVLWAVAGGLLWIGAWIFSQVKDYDHITESTYTLIPAVIIMGAGILLLLLGFIAIVGACKEQKCLLALFFSVLLLIFVGLVGASALAYIYRQQVGDQLKHGIQMGLDNYHLTNDTIWKTEVDFMQEQLSCCGNNNYTDWLNTTWYHEQTNASVQYPQSCCENQQCHYQMPDTDNKHPYTQGCYNVMHDQFRSHLGIILGVAAAFAIVQVLGMVCSCVIICRRKTEVPYIGLNEPTGMRV